MPKPVQYALNQQDDDHHCHKSYADVGVCVFLRRTASLVDLSLATIVDPVTSARAQRHLTSQIIRAVVVGCCATPQLRSVQTILRPIRAEKNLNYIHQTGQ